MSVTEIGSHKVIDAPVNTHDVSKVLGRSSLDVGALCSSGTYINRWAKYKPVVYANLIDATAQWDSTNDGWNSNASWWKGTNPNQGCGITVGVFDDLITMCDTWIGKSDYKWQDFWSYLPPSGGMASPYRLTDFARYVHFHKTFGEDWDKPFAGWHIGADNGNAELHRYQDNGTYYIGENSTIQKRNLGIQLEALMLQLSDIQVKYGNATISLGGFYFGVAFVMNYTSIQANRLYSFITCNYHFNQNVTPSPNNPDNSSGTDLRITPNFPNRMFAQTGSNVKVLALPFLSNHILSDTGVDGASNPCWQGNRNSYGGTSGTPRFVPLPYYGKEVTLVNYEGRIKMIARFGTVTGSSSGLSAQVTVTATSTDGTPMAGWGANDIEIVFQVFPNGEVPTVESRSFLPASSSWSGSDTSKTYTSTYTPGGTASTGKYECIVTLYSLNGNVSAGGGDTARVNF